MTDHTIETLLRTTYQTHVRGNDSEEHTADFVFHMTDWKNDLIRLCKVYTEPEKCSYIECKQALDGMLLHACAHIVQAAILYGGVINPFDPQFGINSE